ncbi:MAG: leucine--tRNA ligase [Endomicrobium sp.]|jgi:leucyl-tRNA synthetase|nr:leucine--tRNA ligase [Endomicrobium sp.]
MVGYDHIEVEEKWQKKWEVDRIFSSDIQPGKEKYYCLVMLPYPSGSLHMGHVRNYVIGDVFARFNRMKGKNVLHTIGWDAFGLPAENAAIKNGIHPAKWTKQNILRMKGQLKPLGISYDWDREITTCDPVYYKWNQWFFIKMWEKGLVFRKNANVNWCSSCNTVLANEQVLGGLCWRCGGHTKYKNLEQWFIRITDYVSELLEGHEQLVGWSEQVVSMQKNWIGKSYGLEIYFTLKETDERLRVFTTRPDTLFGVTFIVVAPEHIIVEKMKSRITNYNEVLRYVTVSQKKSNIERSSSKGKTGVKLEGIGAINPVTKKEIPIFVADYVLTDYATGAVMAVPSHDQRDWEFAKKYNISMIEVIRRDSNCEFETDDISEHDAYEGDGILINSGQFNGLKSVKASSLISEWVEKQDYGKKTANFKLKDWLVSRQRYWGTPIPMIHCKVCGIIPVPEKDLPVLLPEDVEFTGERESPLKLNENFINVKCHKCGMSAKRETDTMDTFVDSSWYYARYCDAHNNNIVFDSVKVNYWMPVDQYIGGIEHACMHLIYSRFWYKFMRDLGVVKHGEPFKNLLTQGMVTLNGNAMSKSKGNVVAPDELIERYGADTIRLFILFAAPPQKQLDWSVENLEGCRRFINRIWRLYDVVHIKSEISASEKDKTNILRIMHRTIKKVTNDIEKEFQFNTAISSIMELVNVLYAYKYHLNDDGVSLEVYKNIVLMMTPFAPHICEEIWKMLGCKEYVSEHFWPVFKENFIKQSYVELPIQINGKLRGKVVVCVGVGEERVREIVERDKKITLYLKDKKILKFIYIKNKIIAIVTG